MRMETTESSETSSINATWTSGTYPKGNKLQLFGDYEKFRKALICFIVSICPSVRVGLATC